MVKTILISQMSLPYAEIGSWTTLYQNYLQSQSGIDIIVCPKPKTFFSNLKYSFVKESLFTKFQTKVLKNRKTEYLFAVNQILEKDCKYIFQLVDNYGMVRPLHDFLLKKGIRKNCYIQFFYHGFDPYQQNNSTENFYTILDEIILLTELTYQEFKNKISVLPTNFSILNNGIDTSKFSKVSLNQKNDLKISLKLENKKVFLWCSQDRPKKGLNLILEAWRQIYAEDKNIILLVVGCELKQNEDGVSFLGKLPNDELPLYYQAADCYLFPTLCHEGFGMSLIEALHCGCHCIASELGGVPEVLQFGKFGKLIRNPNSVLEWVQSIQEFLDSELQYPTVPENMYSMDSWNFKMNTIIQDAKYRLDPKTTV